MFCPVSQQRREVKEEGFATEIFIYEHESCAAIPVEATVRQHQLCGAECRRK